MGYYEVDLDFQSRKLKCSHLGTDIEDYYEKTIRKASLDRFIEELKMMDLLNWKAKYIEPGVVMEHSGVLKLLKMGGI